MQGFDGSLRLALLDHAQNGVQQNDGQDDNDFGPFGLAGQHTGEGADGGGNQQNDQHGVLQLCHKALEQGGLFGFFQLVGAVLGKTLLGLLGRQTFSGGVYSLQNVLKLLAIGVHHK